MKIQSIIIATLLATQLSHAKNNLSLAEVKKVLSEQEYKQYTHELWQKDRKKAKVTDYSDLLKNNQLGNSLTAGPGPDCDFPNILTAINFAASGDSIFIADSTYEGLEAKLTINKDLSLIGGLDSNCQVFTVNRTKLQLNGPGPAVEIDVSGGRTVTLSGLDISNTQEDIKNDYNSGVHITGNGNVTIGNTHLHNNNAFDGGGLSVIGGATVILNENTEIYNNTVSRYGGGIFCGSSFIYAYDVAIGKIMDNNDLGNKAVNDGSSGGGIYANSCEITLGETVFGNGPVEINYNQGQLGAGIFTLNSILNFSHESSQLNFNKSSIGNLGNGNAVVASGNSQIFLNDLKVSDNFEGNTIQISGTSHLAMGSTCSKPPCSMIQRNQGSSIALLNQASADISQTLISDNSSPLSVISINGTNQNGLKMNNSIISNNTSNSSSQSIISTNSNVLLEFENMTIAHNDTYGSIVTGFGNGGLINFNGGIIWGNIAINLTDENFIGVLNVSNSVIQYNPAGMINTLFGDPLFVNPESSDFHIQYDSPARDLFDSNLINDFEGDGRPQGNADDAGADEWTDLIFKNSFEQD
ncbi:MAG: hypothetical protein AB8B80_10590 [Marinicellaceae bacterium]